MGAAAQVAPANSLADEGPLGNGLQGTDPPAHLGCSVELQSHPRVGERVMSGAGTWRAREGRQEEGGRVRASLDAALHHPILAVSPAGAGLVTLEDQWGLNLVKLLEQPPVLGWSGAGVRMAASGWGPHRLPRTPEIPQENPVLTPARAGEEVGPTGCKVRDQETLGHGT